jgi:hypothetical protein
MICALAVCVAMCGCATQPAQPAQVVNSVNFSDPDDISAHIDITYDNFTRLTSFGGPKITTPEVKSSNGSESTALWSSPSTRPGLAP